MNKLFFIVLLSLILLSCKTHHKESVNTYTTPPEVGILTSDLPRYSKPPASVNSVKLDESLPSSKKDSIVTSKDTVSYPSHTINRKNPLIQTVSVSTFSWEIGIRQTQIVDVRTLIEYKSGHIYDAVNMSVDDPSFENQIQELDRNSPVAVYCKSGIRSFYAANVLKDHGFQIIYNLDGGLNSWLKNGKELVK